MAPVDPGRSFLLFIGGINPSPEPSRVFQIAVRCMLFVALLAFCLAMFAAIRGPQRVSAGIALTLSLLYGLVFTGMFFALPAWL